MTSSESPSISPSSAMPVLLLPGWQNSGPDHWQSRWESLHGDLRVQQDDWMWPRRGDWMTRLEEHLLALPSGQRAVLVAHSLGCHLVSAWAAHSRNTQRVAAALLVAPPDLQREDLPPQLASWRSGPMGALPFPGQVVYSSNDAFCDALRALQMAAGWGCEASAAGALGHLNSDSGLGDWAWGRSQLNRLTAQAR